MAWNKIRFNGQDADGCIFTVISGLATWGEEKNKRTPEEVFKEFCYCHLVNGYGGPSNQHLMSHYVFSGPSHGGNHGDIPYARNFADFLEKEKLGVVVRSPMADNKKYHAGRMGEVFIWTPDEKAVSAWWKANRPTDESRSLVKEVNRARLQHRVG